MADPSHLIFGIHAVSEALRAGKELEKVLVRRGAANDQLRSLTIELRARHIPVQPVPPEKLNRVTRKNHQGIVAFLSEISYHRVTQLLPSVFEQGEDPLFLILDGISDVRNFGAIARSAECAGVHGLVIPFSGTASVNADAIKTSAGALHRIPVCRHRDLKGVIRFLRESGLQVFAATEKAPGTIYSEELSGPAAIILGSEEKGIGPVLLKEADRLVSIPMKGAISSLNVSVAAGIILFEVLRQRM